MGDAGGSKKKFGAGRRKCHKFKSGSSFASRAPTFVDGRHPDVAVAGAHEEVARHSRDFRSLSGHTLLTLSIGTCQQLIEGIGSLKFKFSSEKDVYPADRNGHVDGLRAAHTVRTEHLAWLSAAINQLVSVEHALAMHVTSSVNDIEAHEATTNDVCAGCSFTAARFAAKNAAK
jgi:hypothetical protein